MGLTPHLYLECRGPRESRAITLLTQRAFMEYKKDEKLPQCRTENNSATNTFNIVKNFIMKKMYRIVIIIIIIGDSGKKKYIQGVPGGKDLTSGECSLGQTIPI